LEAPSKIMLLGITLKDNAFRYHPQGFASRKIQLCKGAQLAHFLWKLLQGFTILNI
jgi:hypothetical protein